MKKLYLLAFLWLTLSLQAIEIDQVVIWGHKLHSHTHSYIHEGFYRAFRSLGYKVLYLDNNDDISSIDFSKSLFLTEGQVDQNIPILDDCFYIIHNCNGSKYRKAISENRAITIQVYTKSILKIPHLKEVEPYVFVTRDNKTIFFPWATDLLPYEIEENKNMLRKNWTSRSKNSGYIAWVGTIGEGEFGNLSEIQPFIKSADVYKNSNLIWTKRTRLNREEHISFIIKAYMAPTIVGSWQKKQGYIPCRIFKNISYGQCGITNSYEVYDIMNKKICYDSNTAELFYKGVRYVKNYSLEDQLRLMDFVKENHTYLNRIKVILDVFKKLSDRN